MKYTAVFINQTTKEYTTQFFVTSHDKNEAWNHILSETPSTFTLILLIPGEQRVYSQDDISFSSVA
jgi:hypothetical protein